MLTAQNILVLAPHTDDGELGCGAFISKHIEKGSQVTYAAFSSCAQSLPAHLPADALINECEAATKSLGIQQTIFFDFEVRQFPAYRQAILEELVRLNKKWKPDVVLLPALKDVHQDHQAISQEALRAFKFCTLLGYELPWNNTEFQPAYFETIGEKHLTKKMEALQQYTSQHHRQYMKEDFIRSLAVVRGMQANAPLAEAFEVYRIIS